MNYLNELGVTLSFARWNSLDVAADAKVVLRPTLPTPPRTGTREWTSNILFGIILPLRFASTPNRRLASSKRKR